MQRRFRKHSSILLRQCVSARNSLESRPVVPKTEGSPPWQRCFRQNHVGPGVPPLSSVENIRTFLTHNDVYLRFLLFVLSQLQKWENSRPKFAQGG